MNDLKEKLSEYLNKIPVVERKTYVILLCSLLILGFATKSVIKIVRTSEGWENLSTGDNQTISQDQLVNLIVFTTIFQPLEILF